ncbi:MAG: S46 family peptidase [Prevotella sp.]
MVRKIISTLYIAACALSVYADEGMWLLPQLKQCNEKQMQGEGLKLSADDITNRLSQAIILFNGNGTASFVSPDGLVLTNYHCARTGIQQASSADHNYLRDGFWAADRTRELPLRGITMSVNKVIKDVSAEVNALLKAAPKTRAAQYGVLTKVTNKYRQQHPGMQARIHSYQRNTRHILYVTQTFRDIRLVGAPPIDIAKFGGETDNWTWPRHGCDFAILRAYVSKDGKSAAYSKDNVPYHPKHYLKVSAEGYGEGDFAMSMGYPGFTDRRATSMQIWERRHVLNPPLVKVRTARQEVLQRMMRADERVAIQYAEKFATSANYCKNYNGMNEWIDRLDLVGKKQEEERQIVNACGDTLQRQRYVAWLDDMKQGIKAAAPYRTAQTYYLETFGEGWDMLRFVSSFGAAMKTWEKNHFKANVDLYYKDYSETVDRTVAKALLRILVNDLDAGLLSASLAGLKGKGDEAVAAFVDNLYDRSVFANRDGIARALNDPSFSVDNDPAYRLATEIERKRKELSALTDSKRQVAQKAIYQWMAARETEVTPNYYPNADKTLRLSYGTIQPLKLDDGTTKPWQTTMAGVMEKAKSDNPDYQLPDKLKRMWQAKDFGGYAVDGDVPTCFITNGDVTGGNSGSPMLNAKGEVIGLVFDCNWESMLRDFDFNIDLHRVICLDARYVLFMVDKYAGMTKIADELKQ